MELCILHQEVESRLGTNRTVLKINAEHFYVRGSKEVLVFNFQNLLVSVGGYLGLFIGLSLNDVTNFIVDTASIFNKFKKWSPYQNSNIGVYHPEKFQSQFHHFSALCVGQVSCFHSYFMQRLLSKTFCGRTRTQIIFSFMIDLLWILI